MIHPHREFIRIWWSDCPDCPISDAHHSKNFVPIRILQTGFNQTPVSWPFNAFSNCLLQWGPGGEHSPANTCPNLQRPRQERPRSNRLICQALNYLPNNWEHSYLSVWSNRLFIDFHSFVDSLKFFVPFQAVFSEILFASLLAIGQCSTNTHTVHRVSFID